MGYGKVIKTYIAQAGITIQRLSEISGISLNTLYSISKRDPEKITTHNQILLSAAMQLDSLDALWKYYDTVNDHSGKLIERNINSTEDNIEQIGLLMEQLNNDGQRAAISRVSELTEIPRYQAKVDGREDGNRSFV